MPKLYRPAAVLVVFVLGSLSVSTLLIARAAGPDYAYLIGRGKADITGPAVGVQLWGFVRADQIDEGIHFRLFSRAFVIAERKGDQRIAFASLDLGSVTHAMHQEVVERLQKKYGKLYTEDNVILSATHTHSGPSGYWHYGTEGPIGMPLYSAHFEAIVQGIVDSISQSHDDLQPGDIYWAKGLVEGAGANRSAPAYLNNPEAERARYAGDTDKEMTLLKFVDASGAIGMVNWFASHPTAMNFFNKLISGDHKGHASARFEAEVGQGLVAAFAQSNAGDISPNLNLNNTGPGKDSFETTKIIAERQLEVAKKLFDTASDKLHGPIAYRHAYVNMAYHPVTAEFTGAGDQKTCPSAFGYAFAAGSTEDGGGNPLFKEGMMTRSAMIDGVVKQQFKLPDASDTCRACQAEKAILFAPGEMDPPGQSQIVPITLARIGQLTLVCVPAEFTTMAGRRLRETVQKALGESSKHVVIVGYANEYAGYVTTREEYATQQYEGGHTLFGPWTLAAYQQEFSRLAAAMVAGQPVEAGPTPTDLRGKVAGKQLEAPADGLPAGAKFGAQVAAPKASYARGETVEVSFWSGDPRNDFRTGNNFLRVERKDGNKWILVATDNDWSTKCRWVKDPAAAGQLQFAVSWAIPADGVPGVYRICHDGNDKTADGKVEHFMGVSTEFQVK
jgi:neutral ceramidase